MQPVDLASVRHGNPLGLEPGTEPRLMLPQYSQERNEGSVVMRLH